MTLDQLIDQLTRVRDAEGVSGETPVLVADGEGLYSPRVTYHPLPEDDRPGPVVLLDIT